MKVELNRWAKTSGWGPSQLGKLGNSAQLVLAFGSPAILQDRPLIAQVQAAFPQAAVLGCSTAGEICGTQVTDDSLVVAAIHLERSRVQCTRVLLREVADSFAAGEALARSLPPDDLKHVFVLSDGLSVNGSELVRGLTKNLPEAVSVTGGLSGDGGRFQETYVLWKGVAERDAVTAMGFYGPALWIGYASFGGWDPFGPERLITRSRGNVLFELDGKSALELYKRYLGEHAAGLPATGLLFPLTLRSHEGETGVVRTILSVNEEEQSMTFAGNVPEGSYGRFMKANFDRLIDGATMAARACHQALKKASPDLAILISCVGRKMVLKQRVEEEVEGVKDVLGANTALTGFYSYGEISPFSPGARCELHNQTMTITTFREE
jgi:hypothetical protein